MKAMRWRAMSSSSSKNVKASNKKTKTSMSIAKYEKNLRSKYKSISKGQLPLEVATSALCARLPFAMRAAAALARAVARLRTQRHGDQRKRKARHRKCEAAIHLDARFPPAGRIVLRQFAQRA